MWNSFRYQSRCCRVGRHSGSCYAAFVIIIALAAVLVLSLSGCSAKDQAPDSTVPKNEGAVPKAGSPSKKAPSFTTTRLSDEQETRFPDDLNGQPGALLFFSPG